MTDQTTNTTGSINEGESFSHEEFEVPAANVDANGHEVFMPSWNPTLMVWRTTTTVSGETVVRTMTDERYVACGLKLKFDFDEATNTATVTTPRCEVEGGFLMENILHVPSGRLVVADYLGFPIDEKYPSSWVTLNNAIMDLAATGVIYGPTGNTDPTMFHTGEGAYAIATLPWNDPDADPDVDYGFAHEPIGPENEHLTPAGWKPVASIITDLHGYQIMDHDAFMASDNPDKRDGYVVVDVPAGEYMVAHYTSQSGFNLYDRDNGLTVYATITRRPAH